MHNNYYIYTARRRIQCYSFSKPNPQFPSFFLSLAVLTHRSEVHTPTAARRPDYVTHARPWESRGLATGGGSECVCAIACLYLLWKRERRRRRTELLAVILYNYIILYTIIYRAPGVSNGNNHFLLHAAVHPGLHCNEFDGWTLIGCLRYTCHSVATLLNADWQIRVSTFTLYEILSPRRVKAQRVCRRRQKETLRANLYSMFAIGAFYTSPGEHLAIHRIYSIYRPALGGTVWPLCETDLRVSSVQCGLPSPAESSFTPESSRSLILRSSSLRLEELELRTEARASQHPSDRQQPLSLHKK